MTSFYVDYVAGKTCVKNILFFFSLIAAASGKIQAGLTVTLPPIKSAGMSL
jgi:hypothetical protein